MTTAISGTFLCIPAAVLALLSVLWNVPGSAGHRVDCLSAVYRYARNLAGQSLFHATHHYGAGQRTERVADSVLACGSRRRTAVAGGGRSLGEHRGRSGDPGGSVVRAGRSRTTGVAGGSGSRSAAADEYHHPGNAGYLAGQFRGRCNRTYAASRKHEDLAYIWRNWRVRCCCCSWWRITGGELAGSGGYAKQYREAADAAPSHAALAGNG